MTERHIIGGIVAGQDYELRVRGIAGLVRGPWAASVTGTGQVDTTPPGVPGGLVAVGLIRAVALNWANPADLDLRSVEIWEAATFAGTYAKIGETGGTNFLRGALPPGGTAWWKVRAVDRSGNLGGFTAPVPGTASLLLVDDIAQGIIDTAAFAQGIEPVGLVTTGPVPTTKAQEIIFHGPTNQLYRWDSATSAYVRLVRAADVDGLLSSSQISSLEADKLIGQVQSAQLADNSVVASKIAAGAITAGSLAVAPASGNLIWNSCLPFGREGWQVGGTHPPTAWGAVTTHFADNNWRLAGMGTGGFVRAGIIPAGSYADMYWVPDPNSGSWASVPVAPGEWWEFQAQTQRHRCSVELKLGWYDASGTYLTETQVALGLGEFVPGFGTILANYQLLWGKAQAPTGAARMLPFFRVIGEGGWGTATGNDPYLFFTQALVARSHASQTEPRPWGPGGITEVVGGMIRTRSIAADRIIASSITANEIAANAITAGKVAAGAISTTELAAGAVNASKLAASELITLSAQIGNGVITNAKIGNLQVDTIKVAGNAITESSVGSWWGSVTTDLWTPVVTLVAGDGFGGPVFVFAEIHGQIGDLHAMRVIRAGHVLRELWSPWANPVAHINSGFADFPGAGSHAWEIQVRSNNNNNGVTHALLYLHRAKR